MPRIYTDQASSGKPVVLIIPDYTNGGYVGENWTQLAEAPDFSVPWTGDAARGIVLDPLDSDRELRPGEVFMECPLVVANNTATTRWVDVMIRGEGRGAAFNRGVTLDAQKDPALAGSIFCIPANSKYARIYDPVTGIVSTPGGEFPGPTVANAASAVWASGHLLQDGRVFVCNNVSETTTIFNPAAGGSVVTPLGTIPRATNSTVAPTAYLDSVLLDDGRVYCIPFNGPRDMICDPTANAGVGQLSSSAAVYAPSTNNRHLAGVKLGDGTGRVYLIPYRATKALIWNPADGSLTEAGGTFEISGSSTSVFQYRSGVLMSDGRVFMCPATGSKAAIYDPDLDAVQFVPGFLGGGQLEHPLMLGNKVLCLPNNGTRAQLYDPDTGEITTYNTLFPGDQAYAGGVIIGVGPNAGKVFMVPRDAIEASIFDPVEDLELAFVEGTFPCCSDEVVIAPRVPVPGNSSVSVPIQGLRLLKTNYTHQVGGRLMVRAEVGDALKVYGSAVELQAQQHEPDTENAS